MENPDPISVLDNSKTASLLSNQEHVSHIIPRYDPSKIPPNFELAQKHGQAKRVYQKQKENAHDEICPCCHLPNQGKPIPLCGELSKIYHLGSGYSLYFTFIKYSIFLLIVLLLGSGVFNLITNYLGDSCAKVADKETKQYCVQDYIGKFTIANKRDKDEHLQTQVILNFLTILLTIIFFHYIRYQVRRTKIEADDHTVTPSDYTVRLSNLPLQIPSSEIRQWIEGMSTPSHPLKVKKVIRSYDIAEFVDLNQQKEVLHVALKREMDESHLIIESKIEELDTKLNANKRLNFASIAYVTLENAHQVDYLVTQFQKGLFNQGIDFIARVFNRSNSLTGSNVKIKAAPEPTDILWQNLGVSKREKLKRKITTNTIAGILVIFSSGLIIAISFSQKYLLKKIGEGSPWIKILSMAASILLALVNYILGVIIRKLAEAEKHNTYTGYYTGITQKLSVAQFVNTAFTTLIAKIVITSFLGDEEGSILKTVNFFGVGGLLEAMFFVFITNAFSTPIMNIFDPFYYLKRFNQWKALKNPESQIINQKQAHDLFEGMKIDMSYKYSLLIKTMLLTAFYTPAIPVAGLFAMIGLGVVYWTDKYILLRRSALPFQLGTELTESMTEYLEWMTFMFSLGNILVIYSLQDSNHTLAFADNAKMWGWITLIVSLIHIFFPMDYLNKKLFPIKDLVTENESYEEARVNFYTDYDIENPITKEKGLRSFRKALIAKKMKVAQSATDDEESQSGLETGDDEEKDINPTLLNLLSNFANQADANPLKAMDENRKKNQSARNSMIGIES